MRIAHVIPACGASGDMLLGAALDAGADVDDVVEVVDGLGLDGWSLRAERVRRGGMTATRAVVETDEHRPDATWADVRALLTSAALPDAVRTAALAVFERLAAAEARVHGIVVDDVHFHEVGALDALVDVVGTCAALHLLGVERLTSDAVAQGRGTVPSRHGTLPVPAPAVLELLAGAPTYGTDVDAELCTPTGAALLAARVETWGALPPMIVERTGVGAGARDLPDRANVLRLVLGSTPAAASTAPATAAGTALVLETTVDDLPGELVPPAIAALLDAGASDAWVRPVLMKKGRPGFEVCAICPPEAGDAVRAALFRSTTTLGVRGRLVDKWALERTFVTVIVAGHEVALKVARLGDEVVNVKPELADCERVASATGLPLKEVVALARSAFPAPA